MHVYFVKFSWKMWRFGFSVDTVSGPLDIMINIGPFAGGVMFGPPKIRYYEAD